ncbi:hypothetical protein COHA_010116 [Chlorella ohadii]|uniref:Uncharacterized protein n=1 Tax=Chlorella ohadii TaxID=2649997 RepID=A0AAD5DKG9_9CHLO|nr:hypothetical protein COHA_010116 [Chlorella ohadii]
MDPWQPLDGDLDPELALALELDLLSDQDLLDAAVPVGTAQQLPLPLWDTAALGLAGSWGGGAAAGEAAAAEAAAMAAAPAAAAHGGTSSSATGRPATPKKSGKSRSGSGVNRYDKPGARERKQEQQRNYRLRCKERAAEQQAQLAALGTAVEAARQQRQELLDEHAALQKMQEYKESPNQLTERERGFRNLIKAALEEWEANPAGRRRMEYRLQLLWSIRLKCSNFLARMRPELVAEVRASYVLPAPLPATAAAVIGGAALAEGGMEGGVHHILPPIVAQLRINDEQRERILAHWRTYQRRVTVARRQSREAIQRLQQQEADRQQSGIPGPSGSLAGSAGHFLSSLQAASELAALPPEETAAWFELQHGLWKALTPLQNSRLLLGCAPYLPDCTQLCRLLEWQQQRQQLSHGDCGHFLATAVAV